MPEHVDTLQVDHETLPDQAASATVNDQNESQVVNGSTSTNDQGDEAANDHNTANSPEDNSVRKEDKDEELESVSEEHDKEVEPVVNHT